MRQPLKLVYFIFCIFILSCNQKMNMVSYSMKSIPADSISFNDDYQFINYENFIFEFVIRKKISTDKFLGSHQEEVTRYTLDTIKVLIYDLASKNYASIFPFNNAFKVIDTNISYTSKKEGFIFKVDKTDDKITKYNYKKTTLNGMNVFYAEDIDSLFVKKVYMTKKDEFNSPYDFFLEKNNIDFSIIGYSITSKKSSDSFSLMVSNIKAINIETETLCKKIITQLYGK